MITYTLKWLDGYKYNLYNGSTAIPDADATTIFKSGTAGEAYFVFDFDGHTPSDTSRFDVRYFDNPSVTIVSKTGLGSGYIEEGRNYKGSWDGYNNTLSSFAKVPAAILDEAQMSDLMGKIKGAGGIPTNATFWGASYDSVNNKVDGDMVLPLTSNTAKKAHISLPGQFSGSAASIEIGVGASTGYSSRVTIDSAEVRLYQGSDYIRFRGIDGLSMRSFRINSLADPTSAQDAATKNYVDSIYPVGAVFTSTSATAPTIAGGTWTEIGTQTIGTSTVHYYERTA